MPRRFVISDIHGCKKTFLALLRKIDFRKKDQLYLLGDYIDRGPDSRGVIDHIWEIQEKGYQVICLKGNHEQMMLNAVSSVESRKHWLKHGGSTTLQSFHTDHLEQVPGKYLRWLQSLPHYVALDQYILVHAGLNFKKADPLADQESMLWIRDWYDQLKKDWLEDRIIIHGHTPIIKKDIKQMLKYLNRRPVLDIDGGCVFREDKFRQLVAFELNQEKLHFQPNVE